MRTIPDEELSIRVDTDKPKSGMWHCGPNPQWITVEHVPTRTMIRLYSGDRSPHRVRQDAMAMMEMAIAEIGREPCSFPERVDE